jgi:hypothetical protein
MNKAKKALLTAVPVLALTLSVVPGIASAHSNSDKPGWGNGDKHHVHTGPPGQSVPPGHHGHHGHHHHHWWRWWNHDD